MELRSFLTGYAEGEGCFCVSINPSLRHKFGWEIRPSFSVSQNAERSEVLKLFQKVFRCGSIRKNTSDKTLKYEIRSIRELVDKVIPHFQKFPLLSSKRRDFEMFARICQLMSNQHHLSKDGFIKILDLARMVNPSGNKRYPRREVKI